MNPNSSSWQPVASWYNKITGEGGHYYHEHVVIPNVLRLLELNFKSQISNIKLLDIACGNGVLGKALVRPGLTSIDYVGVDIAPSLIAEAKKTDHNLKHKYIVADVTKPFITLGAEGSPTVTHAAIILALQNTQNPLNFLKNTSEALVSGGKLVIVLNHPCFRIPRQSSWGIDERTKMQYRRIDKYMSPMEIPITAHPGEKFSPNTLSYHHSISDYSKMLKEAGFVIELIEEWTSDKESVGRNSKMENRARNEFPLFMAIVARKLDQ